MPKKPKHVIFLGAGASATSGYPLADDLKKKWFSSEADFLNQLWEENKTAYHGNQNHPEWAKVPSLFMKSFYSRVGGDLLLFREGGFGTIDEFCYHMRGRNKLVEGDPINELKGALRFVFATHSPERHFSKSDYYGFIQKLFLPEDLTKLNEEIVILSYNYDIYLEWLLDRAICRRVQSVGGDAIKALVEARPSIGSGFVSSWSGLNKLAEGDSFCLLKLHGMVAWPEYISSPGTTAHPYCCFDDFFDFNLVRKMEKLADAADSQTPIIFPWELISKDGKFASEDQFPIKDVVHSDAYRVGPKRTKDSPSLYEIYKVIWTRAKEEVQAASRISFVGLSMHSYLNDGLKFLFEGRKALMDWRITDSRSVGVQKDKFEPASPTHKIMSLFSELRLNAVQPTVRTNFAEFIEKDIEPVRPKKKPKTGG